MTKSRSVVRDILETVVLTIVIFLLVRTGLQNFRIEGESMLPNFHDGEYILVNKVDYRIFSPHRGDVIVFRAVPAGEPNKDFIKRVIGLPGETIAIRNNLVFINGKPLADGYTHNPMDYTVAPIKIPPHDYYVLGDNRDNSEDSHIWHFLPRDDIIGKAWIAYWPPGDFSIFSAVLHVL
jgi:signal peptidase I